MIDFKMCPDLYIYVVHGSVKKLIFLKNKHVSTSQLASQFQVVFDGHTDKCTQLESPLKFQRWIVEHNMYQKQLMCGYTILYLQKHRSLRMPNSNNEGSALRFKTALLRLSDTRVDKVLNGIPTTQACILLLLTAVILCSFREY